MISKDDLILGQSYFLLGFYHAEMSVPDIVSYILVGENLPPGDTAAEESWWYSQDPETYLELGCFVSVEDQRDCGVLRADAVTLELLHDLEGLIRRLSEVGHHR